MYRDEIPLGEKKRQAGNKAMKRNMSESWTNNGHIRKSHALMGK